MAITAFRGEVSSASRPKAEVEQPNESVPKPAAE